MRPAPAKQASRSLGSLSTESQISFPTQTSLARFSGGSVSRVESGGGASALPSTAHSHISQQSFAAHTQAHSAGTARVQWTSTNINANSFVPPPADPEESQRLLAAGVGTMVLLPPTYKSKVTRLVTPLRGVIKPLPRAHREALQQHELLPSQVQRAAGRARAQGFEDSQWRDSAWGQIKRRAESLARGEQGLDEARSRDEENTLTLSDALLKQLSADPWTRQLYRPKVPTPCRIEAFPVRRKRHFKVRYSWLPQPMVGEAAASELNDARDQRRRSYDPPLDELSDYDEEGGEENGDVGGGGDLAEPSSASSFVTQFDGSTLASLASTHGPKVKKKRPPGTAAKHKYPFHA